MFYSAITPNLLLDLLAITGMAFAAIVGLLIIAGLGLMLVLRTALLALNSTADYATAGDLSIDDLRDMFEQDETPEQRARALHPAGKALTRQ